MKYPHKVHEQDPLEYEFPSTFMIGSKYTNAPLVDTAQLRGHLALMRTFSQLRDQVVKLHEHPKAVLSRIPKDRERRWAWFIGLAVERFTTWCHAISLDDIRDESMEDLLPPIDVIMVWHTYMLNPGWYTEDGQRLPSVAVLQEAGKLFAEYLPQLPSILASGPSNTRVETWTLKTQRVFDPLDDAIGRETKMIYCPTCRHPIQAPLVTNEGKGYLQHIFAIKCPQLSCANQPTITRAVLGARKMAEDLARDDGTMRSYLAGTLYPSLSELGTNHSKEFKDTILSASGLVRPQGSTEEQWIVSILKQSTYSIQNLKLGTTQGSSMASRVLSAYVDDRMFSVELTGAVIRQASFVVKISDVWWAHFFEKEESEIALQHSIARYHAFLDLMASSPTVFLVPTLDIDLVWHTHQLMASKYGEDCKEYVGRFIDHDDKVDPVHLSSSFDDTCRAWKKRFGIQYGHCGCLLPGETIRDRIAHFRGHHVETPAHLVPIEREDILDATHASDHNASFPVGGGLMIKANKKFSKRLKHKEKLRRRVPVRVYSYSSPVATGCVARGGSDIIPPTARAVGRRAVGAAASTSGTPGGSGTSDSYVYSGFVGSGMDGYGGSYTGGGSSSCGGGGGGGGCGGGGSSY